jgi:hypothetical protein
VSVYCNAGFYIHRGVGGTKSRLDCVRDDELPPEARCCWRSSRGCQDEKGLHNVQRVPKTPDKGTNDLPSPFPFSPLPYSLSLALSLPLHFALVAFFPPLYGLSRALTLHPLSSAPACRVRNASLMAVDA